MPHRSTAAVRSAACLTLALCVFMAGCASSGSPISLTQWSWGRSLDLSKNKNQPPSFDPESESDMTRVDPKPKTDPKEPRRLFGSARDKKSDDDFKGDHTHHDREVVPKIADRNGSDEEHWYDRFRPSRSSKSMVKTEAEQRRQQQQYDEAEQLYQNQRYAEAAKLLKPLTKKPQTFFQSIRFWSADPEYHDDHNRVREDSMFLLAESYFKQDRLNSAKGYYEILLKEYPSTRHLNAATRRLFGIGRTWLGMPEFATNSDVTPVNLEDPRATKVPKRQKPPHSAILVPNLFDKTRPVFDTPGNALDSLKSIWLYDPRGPLADDAIMLTASHHLRTGNYQEADRFFSMLREEYPNSPHLQTSFVLGSHVKLMSYQGAGYDEKQLEDARQLKASALRLFPNFPDKERLKDELDRIEEARAQRLWELVELYGRKSKPKAQIIYAEDLLKMYPKSSYAPKAREVLVKLRAPMVEKPSIGTRVLNSLPRLRKPSAEDMGEEEFDSSGTSRLNDEPSESSAPESADPDVPTPKRDRSRQPRPSADENDDDLQLLRNAR
ncbi:MAG: tetratricopeptide repeat protein [Planctomycetaceae bacterium]